MLTVVYMKVQYFAMNKWTVDQYLALANSPKPCYLTDRSDYQRWIHARHKLGMKTYIRKTREEIRERRREYHRKYMRKMRAKKHGK